MIRNVSEFTMPGIHVSLICSRFRFEHSVMTRGNFASTISGMDIPCCLVPLMSSGRRPNDVMAVLSCQMTDYETLFKTQSNNRHVKMLFSLGQMRNRK